MPTLQKRFCYLRNEIINLRNWQILRTRYRGDSFMQYTRDNWNPLQFFNLHQHFMGLYTNDSVTLVNVARARLIL